MQATQQFIVSIGPTHEYIFWCFADRAASQYIYLSI